MTPYRLEEAIQRGNEGDLSLLNELIINESGSGINPIQLRDNFLALIINKIGSDNLQTLKDISKQDIPIIKT